jgi:hypothetical protein
MFLFRRRAEYDGAAAVCSFVLLSVLLLTVAMASFFVWENFDEGGVLVMVGDDGSSGSIEVNGDGGGIVSRITVVSSDNNISGGGDGGGIKATTAFVAGPRRRQLRAARRLSHHHHYDTHHADTNNNNNIHVRYLVSSAEVDEVMQTTKSQVRDILIFLNRLD